MNADFSELRVKMVDGQVRTTDVTDPAIIEAMLTMPREAFVDEERRPLAYIDEDIEIARGRYLMEPSPFAKLVQLADIRPGETVLDVGAGTGYSAAVLSRLAGRVVALESDPALAERARAALAGLAIDNVTVVIGPLAARPCRAAPYDVIFVEGAVDDLPDALFAAAARRRPPGRRRGPGQCRRCAPLSEIGRHCDRPTRLQCGSKATTGLRTRRRVRILSHLVACHARRACPCCGAIMILVTGSTNAARFAVR